MSCVWTREFSLVSRESLKSLLNARLCRLTETARLLKNVKSVFTRRSNAASRVNVEVELSRKLFFSTEFTHIGEKEILIHGVGAVSPPIAVLFLSGFNVLNLRFREPLSH